MAKDDTAVRFGERIREALREDTGPMNGAWWRPRLRRIADAIDEDASKGRLRITERKWSSLHEIAGQGGKTMPEMRKPQITERELLHHARAAARQVAAPESDIMIFARALAGYLGVEVVAEPELPETLSLTGHAGGFCQLWDGDGSPLTKEKAKAVVAWWEQRAPVQQAATRLRNLAWNDDEDRASITEDLFKALAAPSLAARGEGSAPTKRPTGFPWSDEP